jgi:uncharacterized membrane protein
MRREASTARTEVSSGYVHRAPPTPTAPYSPERKARVDSVDLLRGLIMVIMMLDHTRDFVHFQATAFDPTDVSRTYPLLFFTRWITHFCAPIFVFLAGTGAYFQELRGKPKGELSKFLFTRGIWLIVLEFTVLRVIVFFNFDYPEFLGFMQVIWVIGVSMIVLAGLIYLPLRVILVMSVAMIVLHNALDGIHSTSWRGPGSPVPGFGASLWKVLHEPGLIFPLGSPGPPLLVLYPLIPWIGVLAAGYAFGSLYRLDVSQRRRLLIQLGSAITLGFIVIRAINVYGDPSRWSVQSSPVMTGLSFLALSKYPPSLLYLMMTLGPAMLFLAWFEGRERAKLAQIFVVYGRVPLFFYLLQWIVTHGLALAAGRIAGKPTDYLFTNIGLAGPPAPGSGFGLGMVYALWILGVILLYPLCRWYARVKARRHDWWLSYM